MSENKEPLNLLSIRERLTDARGKHYWRSLEDLANTPEFEDFLYREFPREASVLEDAGDRRNFLKIMGASLALAGLGACTRQPTEQILPYTRQPEEIIPGRPLFFATAMPLSGYGTGLLVESHEGRPTKVEGNPDHPASLGASDPLSQASILNLYDPDRSQALTKDTEISSWAQFSAAMREAMGAQRQKNGAGLRILTETVASPTLANQINGILKDLPNAKWHQWEPLGGHNARGGAMMAFGQPVNTYYNLQAADVIVSLDSDFLASGPGWLRYARQFAMRRRVQGEHSDINRLYVLEPCPTPTGSKADHRLPVRASEVELYAWVLAHGLGVDIGNRTVGSNNPEMAKWLGPMVRDLQLHKGTSLVIAGEHQSAAVHALAHAMNAALGNVGKTVFYTDPVEANPVDQYASLQDLVNDLDAGKVDLLLILGGNPAYNAPVELGFKDRLKKARLTVHLSEHVDETSEACNWNVPKTHFLEEWSDCRSIDGTASIVQPLIAPLYRGRSAHEVVQSLTSAPGMSSYEVVRAYWSTQMKGGDFDATWRKAVHDGVVPNTAFTPKTVAVKGGWAGAAQEPKHTEGAIEVTFRQDPSIYDGRFANNGWLQELPQPITKVTWDNPLLISPAMAHRLDVKNGDVVEMKYQGYKIKAPVYITAGHATGAVTVRLGYGRTKSGRVGTGMGFNGYGMRTAKAAWFDGGLELSKTGDTHAMSITQNHHVIDSRRHIVRAADIGEYKKNEEVIAEQGEAPPRTLFIYPEYKYEGYAWGMAVDMNTCTGCNACVIGCVSENNIPVVGKDQVRRGREMHWIRIDQYFAGPDTNPEIYNQPMMCQQCETAPCELVCPVQATSHSSEGLNDMVYNRCVGTRYCSNNCPYKVRRFNFLLFQDFDTPSLKLGRNPDVSVRSRGVMEKCTYCVQRINQAKIKAEREDRKVMDGEIQTACQAACPTEAIVFGDINDPNSRVSKMKAQKTNYGVLAEVNTRPRTTYLGAFRNPNPEIES